MWARAYVTSTRISGRKLRACMEVDIVACRALRTTPRGHLRGVNGTPAWRLVDDGDPCPPERVWGPCGQIGARILRPRPLGHLRDAASAGQSTEHFVRIDPDLIFDPVAGRARSKVPAPRGGRRAPGPARPAAAPPASAPVHPASRAPPHHRGHDRCSWHRVGRLRGPRRLRTPSSAGLAPSGDSSTAAKALIVARHLSSSDADDSPRWRSRWAAVHSSDAYPSKRPSTQSSHSPTRCASTSPTLQPGQAGTTCRGSVTDRRGSRRRRTASYASTSITGAAHPSRPGPRTVPRYRRSL